MNSVAPSLLLLLLLVLLLTSAKLGLGETKLQAQKMKQQPAPNDALFLVDILEFGTEEVVVVLVAVLQHSSISVASRKRNIADIIGWLLLFKRRAVPPPVL